MIDFTKGRVGRSLLLFSLPLLLGNLLQQLYSVVDSVLLGRMVSARALAAVGAATPVVMLLLGVIGGFSVGCSLVVAQYKGAARPDKMRACIAASLVLQMGTGLVLATATLLWGGAVLRLMGVPAELYADAVLYLRISAVTLLFQCLYQYLADTLRAMGESRVPLVFLGTATVLNIVLDTVFILAFDMAVAGVAWATTISAALAGLGILAYCLARHEVFRASRESLRAGMAMLRRITSFGLPTAMQQTVASLGGMFMQAVVNGFGSAAIAAYNTAFKIDNFLLLPCVCLGVAVSTYTAQNIGAGNTGRVKKGLYSASKFSAVFSIVASVLIFVFAEQLMHIFVRPEEAEIVRLGVWGLRVLAPLFLLCNQLNLFISFFRGVGAVSMAFYISFAQIVVRILFSFSLAPVIGLDAVWFCMPVTWILCGGFSFWYYRRGRWQGKDISAPAA